MDGVGDGNADGNADVHKKLDETKTMETPPVIFFAVCRLEDI